MVFSCLEIQFYSYDKCFHGVKIKKVKLNICNQLEREFIAQKEKNFNSFSAQEIVRFRFMILLNLISFAYYPIKSDS